MLESAVENDRSPAQVNARLFQQRWSAAGLLSDDVRLIAAQVEDAYHGATGFGQCVWAVAANAIYLQPLEDELALTEFAANWAWKLRVTRVNHNFVLHFIDGQTGRIQHQGRMSDPDGYFVETLLATARGWGKLVQ